MVNDGATRVIAWWLALSLVSVANIAAWLAAARELWRRRRAGDAETYRARRWQLWLSALFVLGCAFRSVLPRAEAQRICLVDWWIANAVIGRAVATVAELALVAQFTLVLRELAAQARSRLVLAISGILLPAIACAEVCSWYTALTTNFLGSIIEESTWAFTATLMTACFIALWARYRDIERRFIGTAIALGVAYVAFMCTVDVPMYWTRWRSDQHAQLVNTPGSGYLSVRDGWADAQSRRVVTHRWDDWRQEIPWMSLYFTVGVWISIALVQTPLARRARPR